MTPQTQEQTEQLGRLLIACTLEAQTKVPQRFFIGNGDVARHQQEVMAAAAQLFAAKLLPGYEALRAFVETCANDRYDRVGPMLKDEAQAALKKVEAGHG